MKPAKCLAAVVLITAFSVSAFSQGQGKSTKTTTPPGTHYNENAPDHDGDGIPNGQDPDYTASQFRHRKGSMGFMDADGDGLNDNMQDFDGDGIPNGQDPDFQKPLNGSGQKLGRGSGSRGGSRSGTGCGNHSKGTGKGKK